MRFMYRIKTFQKEGGFVDDFSWEWKPFDIGYIEADSKKEARAMLEEEYSEKLSMRSKASDIGVKNTFLLALYEPDDYYDKLWNEEQECEACGNKFTKLNRDKAHDFRYIRSGYCSEKCVDTYNYKSVDFDADGIHFAVIYKITNKHTNMCYIGKTTQTFTLRWYQHFYQSSGTKFHEAIKDSKMEDWNFEVIESFDFKGGDCSTYSEAGKTNADTLAVREQFWIDTFDSIANGYNTATAKKV